MSYLISLDRHLASGVNELRLKSFPENYLCGSSNDEFDPVSWHLSLQQHEQIVAYLRLTPSDGGVFQKWFAASTPIAIDKGHVDLNRLCVDANTAGRGVSVFMMLVGCAKAQDLGYSFGVGSFPPHSPLLRLAYSFGFQPAGPVIQEIEPGGAQVAVQPVLIDLVASESVRYAQLRRRFPNYCLSIDVLSLDGGLER